MTTKSDRKVPRDTLFGGTRKVKVTKNIGPYSKGVSLIHWIRTNSFKQDNPADFIRESSINAIFDKEYFIETLHDCIRDAAYYVRQGQSIHSVFDELEKYWGTYCEEAESEDFEIKPHVESPVQARINDDEKDYFQSLIDN